MDVALSDLYLLCRLHKNKRTVNTELLGIKWVVKLRIIQCGMMIAISFGSRKYLKTCESNDIDTLYFRLKSLKQESIFIHIHFIK